MAIEFSPNPRVDGMFAPSAQNRCDTMRNPNYINLIVSIVILLGILLSYLPQHYRIISRRTSEGISPYFVLLGTTAATSGFANMLTVEPSRQDIACCKNVETLECLAGLLGIAQLGLQWICFAVIFVLFLVFFRYGDASADDEEIEMIQQPRWQTAVMVGAVCFAHGLAVVAITGIITIAFPAHLSNWANSLGVMGALLSAIQYLPQIWTTYHLKHVGSLSIPMMCIQTPGGYVFAASLYARLGWAGWSTWGVYVVTATLQGNLLAMAIYYEYTRAKLLRGVEDEDDDEDNDMPSLHYLRAGERRHLLRG